MAEILLTDDGVGERDFSARSSTPPRSDEFRRAARLATQAKAVLLGSKIYTLRKLHVEQASEAIVLRGRVESFYHKQLAQELIRTAIDGVQVINLIQVVYTRERSLSESDYYSP